MHLSSFSSLKAKSLKAYVNTFIFIFYLYILQTFLIIFIIMGYCDVIIGYYDVIKWYYDVIIGYCDVIIGYYGVLFADY
jgi:hypothetical protein